MTGKIELRELTDTLLVAYLALLGFQVKPKQNEKLISFEVTGDGLTKAIEGFYYSNPPVPILDFCKSYRAIRSALFNLREGDKRWISRQL
jgi:hypothetical protein